MNKLVYLFVVFLFFSCSKNEEEKTITGIYGTVSDVSGEPVDAAIVTLGPDGFSTKTGTNGSYSFELLKGGVYTIYAEKENYVPQKANVMVKTGSNEKCDLTIKLTPAIIMISPDSLDFEEELTTRAFSITNDGYELLKWQIKKDCDWIKEVMPDSGVLAKGRTEAITVVIDRNLLSDGKNETNLVVSSSTSGNAEVRVCATGTGQRKLMVNMLRTYPLTTAAILNGEIIHAGIPAYTERGFVYHTEPAPTLKKTLAKLSCSVNSEKKYSYRLYDLPQGKTYYVRAYASNGRDTVYSTNEDCFVTAESKPEVETIEATDISNGTATLYGKILSVGDPVYTERGFVYGTRQDITIYDGNKVVKDSSGVEGTYSLWLLNIPIPCYFRAYVTNKVGTSYGEPIKVENTEFIELTAAGIAVQNEDIGKNDWESVNAMCDNSTLGGYTDWRLPTKDELMKLYTNRNEIKGFSNESYWSSTPYSAYGDYYCVSFYNGTLSSGYKSVNKSARCVRSLK